MLKGERKRDRKNHGHSIQLSKEHVLTILIHGGVETLAKATGAALVAVCLVYGALALQVARGLAGVHAVTVNAALEEPGASW